MAEDAKRRGRPAKKPELGKRVNVMFRLNEATRDRLMSDAEVAGRSMSEEIERRLERSVAYDDLTRAVREQIRQEMRAEFQARRDADRPLMVSMSLDGAAVARHVNGLCGSAAYHRINAAS